MTTGTDRDLEERGILPYSDDQVLRLAAALDPEDDSRHARLLRQRAAEIIQERADVDDDGM